MKKPIPKTTYAVVNNRNVAQYRFGEYAKADQAATRMNASKDPHMIPLKPYRILEERRE